MPLYKKLEQGEYSLGIWRIEEDISFFKNRIESNSQINNEGKRLQWFATRYLAQHVFGEPIEVSNYANGKPHIINSIQHISISHTANFAGVVISNTHNVGIDIEFINPKIERIAHKFLTPAETELIDSNERIEKLILYWSAKESLFKFYGLGAIDFKTQLIVTPFNLQPEGMLSAKIIGKERPFENLNVKYEFFDNHVLTYIVGL